MHHVMSVAAENRIAKPVTNELSRPKQLAVWFYVLTALVALIVLAGAIVRLTGSGTAIAQWPLINGNLLPPFTQADWQVVYQSYLERTSSQALAMSSFKWMFTAEYLHRLLAAMVGILFIVLFNQTMRVRQLRRRYYPRLVGMAALLVGQAFLGGIPLKLGLTVSLLPLHLVFAFAFFGMTLWMAFELSRGHQMRFRGVTSALGWTAVAALLVQIFSGGLVAASEAGHIMNTWPQMGGALVPAKELLFDLKPAWLNFFRNPYLVQFVHRWWGMACAALIFMFVFTVALANHGRRVRSAIRALASVVVLQILLGVAALVTHAQPAIAAVHLMVGLLLFTMILWAVFELGKEDGHPG